MLPPRGVRWLHTRRCTSHTDAQPNSADAGRPPRVTTKRGTRRAGSRFCWTQLKTIQVSTPAAVSSKGPAEAGLPQATASEQTARTVPGCGLSDLHVRPQAGPGEPRPHPAGSGSLMLMERSWSPQRGHLPPGNRAWPTDLGPDVSLRLSQLEKQPPASLSAASQLRGTPARDPPAPHCAHGTVARTFTEDPVCPGLPCPGPL